MSTQQIQGIVFDLDGTIYQMKHMKIKMTFQLLGSLRFLRKLFAARSAVRKKQFESQKELLEELYRELAVRTGRSVEQCRQWYEGDFFNAFVRILQRSAAPRDGLVPLLHRLRGRQIRLAVVSDFGFVARRLRALQIDPDLFDVVKCSEECGVLKPEPEPFASVARLWNLLPENVLVVGDRADRDGEGAQNAGMPFLGISDSHKKRADFYCWKDALTKIEATTNCGVNV